MDAPLARGIQGRPLARCPSLPPGEAGYPVRWNVIKSGFTRGLAGDARRTPSKVARRRP
jgi:hypothetical protein